MLNIKLFSSSDSLGGGDAMSNNDPYLISATNKPRKNTVQGLREAQDAQNRALRSLDTNVNVIIQPEKDDDEDDNPIGEAVSEHVIAPLKKRAATQLNSMAIVLFAAASLLAIVFALVLARGSGEKPTYCRDLPSWNQTADCI